VDGLDIVQGRTVAVLAYARSGHVVNVFIWSTARTGGSLRAREHGWAINGGLAKGNMEFCAVSDAASAELEQLHRLFAGYRTAAQ